MDIRFTDLDWLLYGLTWILLPAMSITMVYFAAQRSNRAFAAYRINLGLVVLTLLALVPVLGSSGGYWEAGSPRLAWLAIVVSLVILLARNLRARH
jgi:hypothetical protein